MQVLYQDNCAPHLLAVNLRQDRLCPYRTVLPRYLTYNSLLSSSGHLYEPTDTCVIQMKQT